MKNGIPELLAFASFLAAGAAYGAGPCKQWNATTAAGTSFVLPNCMVSVRGVTEGYQDRSIYLKPDGQVSFLSNFGESHRISTDSGWRTYYLLPVLRKPSIEKNPVNEQLIARSASYATFQMSPDGTIESAAGAHVTESPDLSSASRGGVEFNYFPGILLDCGWAVGKSPISIRARSCTIRDRHGNHCELPNKLLFDYGRGDNVSLRPVISDPRSFAILLEGNCPTVKTDALTEEPLVGPALQAAPKPTRRPGSVPAK